MAPTSEDAGLGTASRALFDARPDLVLITTGYGLRRWHDAAGAQGFDGDLLLCLREAAVYVRDPEECGVVAAGPTCYLRRLRKLAFATERHPGPEAPDSCRRTGGHRRPGLSPLSST
ncbi:hypothetical protein [Streptomyces sp.]|uniref:hypothetical protein n=1 Tax=Streptomyces sp. TaxID=1931 RepID=UPI002811E295|nr:hypothetical protein [Streptomyces sp.]